MTLDLLSDIVEYQCKGNLNLYDSLACTRLATQAATGRKLRIDRSQLDNINEKQAIWVKLREDDYPGWLAVEDWEKLEVTQTPYQFTFVTAEDIQTRIPQVIAFIHQAMQTPNQYLWGGTVAPNYDCSGLMQAAFASVGIWLPRDAYQQEAFTQALPLDKGNLVLSDLRLGDLIFFGSSQKTTHVGLYLGEGRYIHSSGAEHGRNGIGIDVLSEQGDAISQAYFRQLQGAGRVISSYQPSNI